MPSRTGTASPHSARRHGPRQPSPDDLAAAVKAYTQLLAWRQKHSPWLLEAGGPAIFFRLISAGQAIPTTKLYRGSGASPPKVRKTLTELRRNGFVTVTADPNDRRREMVEATNLLRRLARCYVHTMIQLLEPDKKPRTK